MYTVLDKNDWKRIGIYINLNHVSKYSFCIGYKNRWHKWEMNADSMYVISIIIKYINAFK